MPRVSDSFRSGDTLRIGDGSSARVLCPDRLCQLAPGEYDNCCAPACAVVAQMMRTGAAPDAPVVRRIDLPDGERSILDAGEANIRNLQMGPVTTQFLITKLYSGWKLEETKQQLDQLTVQLEKPEAKLELKQNYSAIRTKTGDMQKQFYRIDKAKELYKSSLDSPATDPLEKANTRVRLAEAENQSGNQAEAVRNLEKAREIYQRQGETSAVEKTDSKIESIKRTTPLNRRAIESRPLRSPQP